MTTQILEELRQREKTGAQLTLQDLIDAGMRPKTSAQHLALIAYKRVKGLREKIASSLDETMLGKWEPAYEEKDIMGKEITNAQKIKEIAVPGMQVEGTRQRDYVRYSEVSGVIRRKEEDRLYVDWGKPLSGMNPLTDIGPYVTSIPFDAVKLVFEQETSIGKKYTLRSDVVADEKLGHRVRFSKSYKGTMDTGYRETIKFEIPEGTTAWLTGLENDTINVKFDQALKTGQGNRLKYTCQASALFETLEASSLGQIDPKDITREIRTGVLRAFMPTTVVEEARAERIILATLIENHQCFHGPPGSGKSRAVKDLARIATQQKNIPEIVYRNEMNERIGACKMQCNPFSLTDHEFAKLQIPCPECKEHHSPGFLETGMFTPPKPQNVHVTMAKYGRGNGIEYIEGAGDPKRANLAGWKPPSFADNAPVQPIIITGKDRKPELGIELMEQYVAWQVRQGRKTDAEYDPKGFITGKLQRGNSGIVLWDELEKTSQRAINSALDAMENGEITPEQQRYTHPARTLVLATANDNTLIDPAINDRMFLIGLPHITDPDDAREVRMRSRHGKIAKVDDIPVGDTHKEPPLNFRIMIPIPEVIEQATDRLYQQIRSGEYKGEEMQQKSGIILASGRSLNDALDIATAKVALDQIIHEKKQTIVTPQEMMFGIHFAMYSRVQTEPNDVRAEAHGKLGDWIYEQFPKALTEVNNKWWCGLYQNISVAERIIPGTEARFNAELAEYAKDPVNALPRFEAVNLAQSATNPQAKLAKAESPFMNFLFTEQANMQDYSRPQVEQLVAYYMANQSKDCQ